MGRCQGEWQTGTAGFERLAGELGREDRGEECAGPG